MSITYADFGYASVSMGDSRALILARVRALVIEQRIQPSQLAEIAKKSRPWATSVLKGDRNFTLPTADRVLEFFGESVQIVRGTQPVTGVPDNKPAPHDPSIEATHSAIGVLREQRHDTRVAILEIHERLSRLLERELTDDKTGTTQSDQAKPRRRSRSVRR